MTSQPDNSSENMPTDDFDDLVLFQNGYQGTLYQLNATIGNTALDSPTLPIGNPLNTFRSDNDPSTSHDNYCAEAPNLFPIFCEQESSPTLGDFIENLDDSILDSIDTQDSGTEQPANTDAQQAVAKIANDLQNSVNEYSQNQNLQKVRDAINRYDRPSMQIRTQPVGKYRFRYRTDGLRYVERSRSNPMAIRLPILVGCLTAPDQSFWIEANIITTRNNPRRRAFLHQHEMFYNGEGAEQNGLQSFRIPLTESDIQNRIKIFRHICVVKTKLKKYQFELIPFDPLISDEPTQHYTLENGENMNKVQKAKRFDREYDTDRYQIVCQLMIKQGNQWHKTDLYCETQIVTNS